MFTIEVVFIYNIILNINKMMNNVYAEVLI